MPSIWILDGAKMEEAIQLMNVRHQFANERDKEQLVIAIETLDRIKASAIKINSGYEQDYSSELTIVKQLNGKGK